MNAMTQRVVGVAAVVIVLLAPLVLPGRWERIMILVGVFALLSLGLNVVVGWAGLLDLGYVAFYASGAYTAAILSGASPIAPGLKLSVWLVFPIAMLVSMVVGVILGAPVLRLRGDYLAIVTLGFGEIVRIVANNLDPVTRGPRGLTDIPAPSLFGYDFGVATEPFYYLLVGLILLAMFALGRINDSRIGRAWIAIREDEVAAEAMGVNTLKFKLVAFAIGAGTASFAGVVTATNRGAITPRSFTVFISIIILAQVVLGGMGSMVGAVVGSLLIWGLPEIFRQQFEDLRFLIFGAVLVIMMIFRPQGIIPSRRRAAELLHAPSEEAATSIPTEMERGDI